jgi:membrane fusion protein, multidrug efflux system
MQSRITQLTTKLKKRPAVYLGGGAVLLSAVGLASGVFASEEPAPAAATIYVTAEPVRADTSSANCVTGIVQSVTPLQASAVNGGRIVAIKAQIGDRVEAGQVLAVIDGRAAALRVVQAESDVRRAEALAGERATAANRADTLVASGAMAEAERDAARAEARSAANALAAARAAAALAQTDAGFNVIRAPGAGVVASRSAELGGVVTPGQLLFAIESRAGGMIMAAVPVKLAPSIRPGMRVRYEVDGISGTARVVGASPRIEGGGVAPVRLTIESGAPAPGSIVRVQFSGADADAQMVRLPIAAIQTDARGQRFVYRIDAGRATPTPITVRALNGADARVSAALRPGTPIVAAGGAFLRPGQHVQIAKPGV